jgi:MFS family permease
MEQRGVRSLLLISASHGVMHSYLVFLSALLPLMKEELGNYEIIGLLISIVYLVYGWGSLPIGILADRYSKKQLVISSMILCGLSSFIVGLAEGLISIAISLFLLGIGTSLYHPAGFSLISLISERMRGRYMGVHGLGGNAGMAVAFISSAIFGQLFGWRNAFILWGIVGIAMGVLDAFLITEPIPKRDTNELKTPSANINYYETLKSHFFNKQKLRSFALVFIVVVFSGALWNGVSSFIIAYLKEVKGIDLIIAGGLATISYVIGSLATMIGGELSDKFGRRIILLTGFSTFAITLLLFTLPLGYNTIITLLVVSLLGFTFYLTQSPLNALLGDVTPPDVRGLAYGINFMIKYGIGGFSPLIAGYLAENFSMDYIFYFFAILSALAFLISLCLSNKNE